MNTASSPAMNRARWQPGYVAANVLLTPPYIVDAVRAALGGRIGLDPCTEPDNPVGADRFVSLPDDGLAIEWRAGSVYVNPPYGDARKPWVRRALEVGQAGTPVALLIPARTEDALTQAVMRGADASTFIEGRVTFEKRRANGHRFTLGTGSLLASWNADLGPLRELGVTLT